MPVYFSVVIPVFCCHECLDKLCERLLAVCSKINKEYEIILVVDGCPENSWEKVLSLSSSNEFIRGINLSRNFGQHAAIFAGLECTKGEWVVVMDCDMQDRPEEIDKLLSKALEGYDLVLARRYNRCDGFFKRLNSRLFYALLTFMTDAKQDRAIANFGIYNRKVINAYTRLNERSVYFPVMVRWLGFKAATVDVEHAQRYIGQSSYTLKKLIGLALDVAVSFSDKPLKLAIKSGLVISCCSMVYAFFVLVYAYLGFTTVTGWASLIISLWFLSGLIIVMLGILGIYIGRIFDEVKNRPRYIVMESSPSNNSSN